jgi:hypothetical protein
MSSDINNEVHAASASAGTAQSASVSTPPAQSASVSATHSTSEKNPGVINLLDTASILAMTAEEENDGLPINKKLQNAYEEMIMLLCGNDLHQESEKSKEKELGPRLLMKMKSYVLSDRFNIDFADQLKNDRGSVFIDHFKMVPMPLKYKSTLLKMFEQQDNKSTDRLFEQYKNIVSFIKNVGEPNYKYKPGGKSGTYTDENVLESIWKDARQNIIKENRSKHQSSFKLKLQKDKPDEAGDWEASWKEKHLADYDKKLSLWKSDPIPTGMVAFVLCGSPSGMDLPGLSVGGTHSEPESKRCRHDQRQLAKQEADGKNTNSIQQQYLEVKKQEIVAKEKVNALKEREIAMKEREIAMKEREVIVKEKEAKAIEQLTSDVSFSRLNTERKVLEEFKQTHTGRYKEIMKLLFPKEGTATLKDDDNFSDANA